MMEEITNGGLPEVVPYKAARKYWSQYIDMEMRDPNGLDRNAKAALAMFKHIAKLEAALRFYADENEYRNDQGEWDMATSPIDRDNGEIARKALEE